MHIGFNCVMLYQLGGRVENRYGTLWMATLVICSAILSNLAQVHCSGIGGWIGRLNHG